MRNPIAFFLVLLALQGRAASTAGAPAADIRPAALPALYVVGDSTAAKNNGTTIQGWGMPFLTYFDPAKINVVNAALGGRSSRTFITEGHLDALLAKLQPGDIVLIQWGHNDPYPLNDANGRGSLFGLGDETEDIIRSTTNLPETLHTFGWYMRKYIADISAKGAKPIVLTLTIRDRWYNGKIERTPDQVPKSTAADGRDKEPTRYSLWSADIAKAANVPLLDVHNMIADRYDREGTDIVSTYFNCPSDPTHRNPKGAAVDAEITLACLKAFEGPAFNAYLNDPGKAVAAADAKYIFPNLALTTPAATPPAATAPAPAATPPSATGAPPAPTAAPTLHPALFLVGDSIMKTGNAPGNVGPWGMGYEIIPLFDAAKIHVYNEGAGGRSSRGYIEEGLWGKVVDRLQPGDFVIVMFGHNDAANSANYPNRLTVPGSGDETKEIDSPVSGKKETIHTYGWYMQQYAKDAKTKGATLIICSPVPRNTWVAGKIKRGFDGYAGWAADAAKAAGVQFIDLNTISADKFDALGQQATATYFADNQHTTKAGAKLNAESVIAGIKLLKDNPLTRYLSAAAPAAAPK